MIHHHTLIFLLATVLSCIADGDYHDNYNTNANKNQLIGSRNNNRDPRVLYAKYPKFNGPLKTDIGKGKNWGTLSSPPKYILQGNRDDVLGSEALGVGRFGPNHLVSGSLGSGGLGSGTSGSGGLGSEDFGVGFFGSGDLGSGSNGLGDLGSVNLRPGDLGSGNLGSGVYGSGGFDSENLGSGVYGSGVLGSGNLGSLGYEDLESGNSGSGGLKPEQLRITIGHLESGGFGTGDLGAGVFGAGNLEADGLRTEDMEVVWDDRFDDRNKFGEGYGDDICNDNINSNTNNNQIFYDRQGNRRFGGFGPRGERCRILGSNTNSNANNNVIGRGYRRYRGPIKQNYYTESPYVTELKPTYVVERQPTYVLERQPIYSTGDLPNRVTSQLRPYPTVQPAPEDYDTGFLSSNMNSNVNNNYLSARRSNINSNVNNNNIRYGGEHGRGVRGPMIEGPDRPQRIPWVSNQDQENSITPRLDKKRQYYQTIYDANEDDDNDVEDEFPQTKNTNVNSNSNTNFMARRNNPRKRRSVENTPKKSERVGLTAKKQTSKEAKPVTGPAHRPIAQKKETPKLYQ